LDLVRFQTLPIESSIPKRIKLFGY